MLIRTCDGVNATTDQATIEMKSGDRVSVGIKTGTNYHIITLDCQGSVVVVSHEQSGDSLVVRPGGCQYVKG
jgi:hypothetical protein